MKIKRRMRMRRLVRKINSIIFVSGTETCLWNWFDVSNVCLVSVDRLNINGEQYQPGEHRMLPVRA